jgi:hypothetical protein
MEDFHLLSLNPEMFDLISFVSPKTCLPIATTNVGAYSRLALTRGYGGINGHYLLVSNGMIFRHHQKNQKVGTGFVESVNCLFRELNRGVDWVFSNDAAKLQTSAIMKGNEGCWKKPWQLISRTTESCTIGASKLLFKPLDQPDYIRKVGKKTFYAKQVSQLQVK